MPSDTLICDIETYKNYFLVGLKRVSDGKKVYLEESTLPGEIEPRVTIDRERLRKILLGNRIVTFNGIGFDGPLLWYFIDGASVEQVKRACNQIIEGNVRPWDVENLLGIRTPKQFDHIDLIEVQPNAFASLKTLNGRLHGKKMQDLPYDPNALLTAEQMDLTTEYCGNDLDATHLLLDALEEPLKLREALGEKFGMDLRSKSDAQMGEAIIKRRVEELTGRKILRVETPPGTIFRYKVPDYLRFERPELQAILDRLRTTDFVVKADGKVDMPKWLSEQDVTIGSTTYAMGIGGLHSTEKNRSVHSDFDHDLIDFDVASYYPAIILGSGLYPKALGPEFLRVYGDIRADRVAAKRRAQEIGREIAKLKASGDTQKIASLEVEREEELAKDKGFKIASNGAFGKLGSRYSILYAPHLMIAVTLTGQLALLMLIERAEAAGIPVVSGNTDGVVFRCPHRLRATLIEITAQWERETCFELEDTPYRSLYNLSVNTYAAVKPDGKVKRKGVIANPRADGDIRTQMMINPSMNVVGDAVCAHLVNGADIEQFIRGCTDIRDFVTVVNVKGGGTWRAPNGADNGIPAHNTREELITLAGFRPYHGETWLRAGDSDRAACDIQTAYEIAKTQLSRAVLVDQPPEYLGKVVRYIWSTRGAEILYKTPHPTTGNFKKVSNSDGCRPVMDLPDEFPTDIDYARYIEAARDLLIDLGATAPPVTVKAPRVLKAFRLDWLRLAIAA